jgi:hypothetical protein
MSWEIGGHISFCGHSRQMKRLALHISLKMDQSKLLTEDPNTHQILRTKLYGTLYVCKLESVYRTNRNGESRIDIWQTHIQAP